MTTTILSILAGALSISSVAQAAAVPDHKHGACRASSYWPGWAGIKNTFIFGDSYTTTGFATNLTQPSASNPLGNPTYPGYTASNGPNWVDYLTVKYNSSTVLTYNLAYGGATMDSALVAPYETTVVCINQQIQAEWFPVYAGSPAATPWTSSDTLFAVFDGINDVGNSWWTDTVTLNAKIFDVYHGLLASLYYAGARNFAFLNVPPVDRSPLASANSAADQATEKADIASWNSALLNLTQAIKKDWPDVNLFTIDTNKYFTEVLDNPASFLQTAGYKNTTSYCTAYENGTPATDTFTESCGIPVNEYFWLNSLHPTYPMHDVLAQQVAAQLNAGPNVC